MWVRELGMTWPHVWLTLATAAGVYVAIIVFSRVWGQRQFAQLSTYDLAFIFALGSLAGRVILVEVSLLTAVLGLAAMFALHSLTGWLHHHVPLVHRAIQNRPILLVADGRIVEQNLRRAHTSHLEVYTQLRLAGVGSLDDIRAMMLERNGSFSIIRADEPLDEEIFGEVVGRGLISDTTATSGR